MRYQNLIDILESIPWDERPDLVGSKLTFLSNSQTPYDGFYWSDRVDLDGEFIYNTDKEDYISPTEVLYILIGWAFLNRQIDILEKLVNIYYTDNSGN